jgi:hypothetical protein
MDSLVEPESYREVDVMKKSTSVRMLAVAAGFGFSLGIFGSMPLKVDAQSAEPAGKAPRFEVDPSWPKPLPDRWVTGEVGGVCVDAQDHVFTMNRGNLSPFEEKTATASPPVIEFDSEGNVVNSWGNRDLLPDTLHSCTIDYQNNIWIGGSKDGIVQKYTHDGSRMLLQIGIKGKFDTSVGTISGAPMNSSHERLNLPTQVAVDPADGDVYISDGYGNRRVVVFDREGHFLRQWGRQGTVAEVDAGVGGVFLGVVHCVVIGNDGLVYVCDRFGDRIEVFDKMGNFQRNIRVEAKIAHFGLPYEGAAGAGSAGWVGFSPDPAQKFLYVGTGVFGEVRILDRATGQSISSFGRPGHQSGDISSAHSLAVDSKGNIIVAETNIGRRVQKFKPVK